MQITKKTTLPSQVTEPTPHTIRLEEEEGEAICPLMMVRGLGIIEVPTQVIQGALGELEAEGEELTNILPKTVEKVE